QLEIYLAGLQGVLPSFPMAFAELEARAERALPSSVLSYVAGGAGSEHTQRANVSAFAQWGLIPRMFVGAARRDLSVELFGMALPVPAAEGADGRNGPVPPGRARRPAPRRRSRTYRRPDDRIDPVRRPDGGRGRPVRRYSRLLPAVHADRTGPGRQPGLPGRSGRLPRHRGHAGHLGHRLAPAR